MRFIKTIDASTFDRGNYRRVQPGQWIVLNGVKGQVSGVTKAGVIHVLWNGDVADPLFSILRAETKQNS